MEYLEYYQIRKDYKKYKENIKLLAMYNRDMQRYAESTSFTIPANDACEKMLDFYETMNKLSRKIKHFEKLLYYHFDAEEIETIDFFLTHTIAECAEAWKISYRSVYRRISLIEKIYKGVKNGTFNK